MRILAFLPLLDLPEHLRAMAALGHEVHVVTTLQRAEDPHVEEGITVWPLGYWWHALNAARPDVIVEYEGDRMGRRIAGGIPGRRLLRTVDADTGEFEEGCLLALPPRERPALRAPGPGNPLAGHPVRVVAWVHYGVPYRRAGSETMLQTMMRSLKDAGVGVLVLCSSMPEAPPAWEVDGVPYLHAAPYAAEMLLERVRPQAVVTHHHYAGRAIGYARKLGARSVLLLHSDHDLAALGLRAGPDLCVYNTEWVRASVGARYEEAERTPSLIVHPPVIPGEHRTAAAGTAVTLVNLNPDKGVETWRSVAEALPDLPFLGVAGAHGRQVRDGMPENVALIGQTSRMRDDVWARTRLLAAPSVYESYGMGAVEALASGIPVIAHPTPGLREALGEAALFVDRSDLSAWTQAVQHLYQDGPARDAAQAAALARSAYLADRTGRELAQWVDAVRDLAGRRDAVRERALAT